MQADVVSTSGLLLMLLLGLRHGLDPDHIALILTVNNDDL
jgi:high-affinity nickel-transport protein